MSIPVWSGQIRPADGFLGSLAAGASAGEFNVTGLQDRDRRAVSPSSARSRLSTRPRGQPVSGEAPDATARTTRGESDRPLRVADATALDRSDSAFITTAGRTNGFSALFRAEPMISCFTARYIVRWRPHGQVALGDEVWRSLRSGGVAAPLRSINVDTDAIIPAVPQDHKANGSQGLFSEKRYCDDGSETRTSCSTNRPIASQDSCCRRQFRLRSSREHAPWALKDFGITCVIRPRLGISSTTIVSRRRPPIEVTREDLEKLFDDADAVPMRASPSTSKSRRYAVPNGGVIRFEVDPHRTQERSELSRSSRKFRWGASPRILSFVDAPHLNESPLWRGPPSPRPFSPQAASSRPAHSSYPRGALAQRSPAAALHGLPRTLAILSLFHQRDHVIRPFNRQCLPVRIRLSNLITPPVGTAYLLAFRGRCEARIGTASASSTAFPNPHA